MKFIIIVMLIISYVLIAGLMKVAGKNTPPMPIKKHQENNDN